MATKTGATKSSKSTKSERTPMSFPCLLHEHNVLGLARVGKRFVCKAGIKELTPAQQKRVVIVDEAKAKAEAGIENPSIRTGRSTASTKAPRKGATKAKSQKARSSKAA